jgi:molecular chaperone GrpE
MRLTDECMARDDGDTTGKTGEDGAAAAPSARDAAATAAGEPRDTAEARISALETRLREVEAELERRTEEAKTNYDRYVRERADIENFKKRAAREREEVVRYGTETLVRALLPIIDNLERAVEHAESGGNGQPLVEGVMLVLKALRDALEQNGVRAVRGIGERFDPAVHEAMEQVESADHEPNTVVREHQKGYMLHERLIRPALVGVSRRPAGGGSRESGGGSRA